MSSNFELLKIQMKSAEQLCYSQEELTNREQKIAELRDRVITITKQNQELDQLAAQTKSEKLILIQQLGDVIYLPRCL